MELSLERYRYAALPNKFRENSEDKRLQPRVSLKLFPGSQLITQVMSSLHIGTRNKYSKILA